ncbi:hypothetical protein I6B53_01505 [Schaalia sp. 19OD2882]|uniref:hypothetical protein n=1 Tax=Schaalia sp. 19OD2882 TaxID=2794089 RepID=UPI001C1EBE46|nr:hypothetical protein [Schaalia sp. 19OD2882]QWW19835.1 hypothetical protein I6B53_01505 [Schaalia sp. 19OD2882]
MVASPNYDRLVKVAGLDFTSDSDDTAQLEKAVKLLEEVRGIIRDLGTSRPFEGDTAGAYITWLNKEIDSIGKRLSQTRLIHEHHVQARSIMKSAAAECKGLSGDLLSPWEQNLMTVSDVTSMSWGGLTVPVSVYMRYLENERNTQREVIATRILKTMATRLNGVTFDVNAVNDSGTENRIPGSHSRSQAPGGGGSGAGGGGGGGGGTAPTSSSPHNLVSLPRHPAQWDLDGDGRPDTWDRNHDGRPGHEDNGNWGKWRAQWLEQHKGHTDATTEWLRHHPTIHRDGIVDLSRPAHPIGPDGPTRDGYVPPKIDQPDHPAWRKGFTVGGIPGPNAGGAVLAGAAGLGVGALAAGVGRAALGGLAPLGGSIGAAGLGGLAPLGGTIGTAGLGMGSAAGAAHIGAGTSGVMGAPIGGGVRGAACKKDRRSLIGYQVVRVEDEEMVAVDQSAFGAGDVSSISIVDTQSEDGRW